MLDGTSAEADDVKRILTAVRQIASAQEVLEVQPDVLLNDIAEGMGKIEEDELRLDETKQGRLRDRLAALTQSPAIEVHAKARSLQQDRENTYCRARIITDLRPIFGSDVRHLDLLSELIERARLKAESLHAFTAAADLREIN